MRSLSIAAIISVFLLAGCSNNTPQNAGTESAKQEAKKPVVSRLNDAGTLALENLLADYYAIKDAFVASNSKDAATAAEKLKAEVDTLNIYLISDTAMLMEAKPLLDTIAMTSSVIATEKTDVEKQRISLGLLSDNMYALLHKTELKNAKVYQEFCPMAMNDKGAHWLSSEEEIKNPYFGKKMIECGEVTDSLK